MHDECPGKYVADMNEELVVLTWRWGQKYGPDYVRKLAASLKRHLTVPYRFLCVTDEKIPGIETTCIKDPGLTKYPGCICRLRLFDDVWQRDIGIEPGARAVCIDLDLVVTGKLDGLFDRPEPFVILQGANASNPNPYNGSVFMFRGGAHPELWNDFTLQALKSIPCYEFPDDQGWFWHKLPNAAGWKVGPESGIYAFQKPAWPKGDNLPKDARMVAFPGWRDPSKFKHLTWIKEHWH